MKMYSFYIVRGHKLRDLESLSALEMRFYIIAMNEYYIEKAMMFGAKEEDLRYEKYTSRK